MAVSFASQADSLSNNFKKSSESTMHILMKVNGDSFQIELYDNPAVEEFIKKLPLELNMSDLNGNEKKYDLPFKLPVGEVRPGVINNGDLMLYGSRTLVLFYENFNSSYSYTRIGKVNNPGKLKDLLGNDNSLVKFTLYTNGNAKPN
jgi:hypothetical protein